jgi:membrane-bound metal-dependent hydrolase YbcI (DUF457 family)
MSTSTSVDTVEGAASSFILLLAGAFGVMPDTMDFKMGQFFSIGDYEIDPDPINPDPQAMADTFAKAVKDAGDNQRVVKVQFFPTQLGANKWRQYNIIFEKKEVIIQFNEVVSTSQIPLEYELKSRTEKIDWLNKSVRFFRRIFKGPDSPPGPVKPTTLDILSGTQYAFHPESEGTLYFNWLPWHRTWSHSYVLGFFLSIPVGIITYLLDLKSWWLYPIVAFLGFFVHITEDMTGHIGGSLFWPFCKTRSEGLELFKASDPRTNFSIDYTAIVMIIHNVDRFSTKLIDMPWWEYYLWFLVLPLIVYFWIIAAIKNNIRKEKNIGEREADGQETADGALD